MWETAFVKKTGQYHKRHSMKCQDQVIYKEKNQCQVIVLADGAGKDDKNVVCVKEVIEYTADMMLRFAEKRGMQVLDKEDMIQALMNGVVCIISKYMDRWKLPAEMFGSTLLGVVLNHGTGQYLLIHLGDGIIIGKSEDQIRVLSYPVNKGYDHTFLTVSENLLERMKVKAAEIGELNQFVLCSDGVYDCPIKNSFTHQEIWDILDRGIELSEKEDDQSMIQLRRKNNGRFDGNP